MITENYPIGPLGGVAFNATLLSYNHSLDIGIHIDSAAVEHPELLRYHMQRALNRLIAAAPRATAPVSAAGLPTWRQRLRARLFR